MLQASSRRPQPAFDLSLAKLLLQVLHAILVNNALLSNIEILHGNHVFRFLF
jgi:hypothetical protein